MKKTYLELQSQYPMSIAGIIDALFNSRLEQVDFEHAKKNLSQCFEALQDAIQRKTVDEIIHLKEHIASGFVKEGACAVIDIDDRKLCYDPYQRQYALLRNDGYVVATFTAKKPKEAVYFAGNIL